MVSAVHAPPAARSFIQSAASPDIIVGHPWLRVVTPQVPAGGYMTLRNASAAPETLTGARSPSCAMLMLHRTEGERMVPVPSVVIPPGSTLTLAPGGYHLMCMRPAVVRGDTMQVTLTFQDGTAVTATVPVIGATDQPPE